MGMFLARGDGLWTLDDAWVQVACPLAAVHFADMSAGHVAAIDDTAHALYLDGRVLPCDRDIEALRLWNGHAVTLSSNTDCLSVADGDGWLVTARIGVYPQDMCLFGDDVLACGGADGHVHRLKLPQLTSVAAYAVPGMALRIHACEGAAHVLCTAGDDGMVTQCWRVALDSGLCTPVASLAGIPGAVRGDGSGGIWAATSEGLYHLSAEGRQADAVIEGFGLIRHIDVQEGIALVTDPILDQCALVTPGGAVIPVWHGNVGQAGFLA